MWPGKRRKRRRRRPLVDDWRDAEIGPEDEQRIEEIRRSFEEQGWRLSVKGERGSWVAWFFAAELGPSTNDVVSGRTALEAALAARDRFRGEPPVGGIS
jgi:hypothetical protein